MRLVMLELEHMSDVGAFVMNQVCREVFAGGERFGNIVFGTSVMLAMSLELAFGLSLDGVGVGVGVVVVLLGYSSACWLLDLSIRGLLGCMR